LSPSPSGRRRQRKEAGTAKPKKTLTRVRGRGKVRGKEAKQEKELGKGTELRSKEKDEKSVEEPKRRRKAVPKGMEKKPIATIRPTLIAGKAAPSPLLGQALGQYGINIMEFCKNFNNQTKNLKEHVYIPTGIKIYNRDSFEVIVKTPSTTFLLKQTANITKGSSNTKKSNLEAFILLKEIYHTAILKKCDRILSDIGVKPLCRTILGTAKSMGLIYKTGADMGGEGRSL